MIRKAKKKRTMPRPTIQHIRALQKRVTRLEEGHQYLHWRMMIGSQPDKWAALQAKAAQERHTIRIEPTEPMVPTSKRVKR